MAEKPPPRVAIIGRNVSAALWTKTLRELHPTAEIAWYRHPSERDQPDTPAWILVNQDTRSTLPEQVPVVPVTRPWIFLEKSRRIPLQDFLNGQGAASRVHSSVRRKWAAIGLFNDLSPSLWKSPQQPDPDWTQKDPLSLSQRLSQNLFLVPRNAALAAWEDEIRARNVTLPPADCGVFGIEANFFADAHQLLHNAPFGVSSADRILWTSALQPFRGSAEKKGWKKVRSPKTRLAAQWVCRTTQVPDSRVAGLPIFSLWLDPSQSENFLKTGIWTSGSLKRVLCLPSELTGQAGGSAWLQIEELISLHQPSTVSHSVDGFLSNLCPALFQAPRRYSEWRFDESSLFADPRPQHEVLGRGIEFWHPSSLGDAIPAATRWQARHLPLKKKA